MKHRPGKAPFASDQPERVTLPKSTAREMKAAADAWLKKRGLSQPGHFNRSRFK